MDIQLLIDTCRHRWAFEDVRVSQPASLQEVESFEQELGRQLSSTFRFYLFHLNGMNNQCDAEVLSFWSLERIRSVPPRLSEDGLLKLIFCDFLIESHFYWLSIGPSGEDHGVHAGDPYSFEIASSFEAFLDLYLVNRDSVIYI